VDDQDPADPSIDPATDLTSSDSFRIEALSTRLADPAMRVLYTRIRQLATDRIPVLISGESGVGKEVVARSLHRFSPWASAPLVAINCGAIPAGLIETELFGHEKGAFSGAATTKLGLIESADGGTIFFDEIGELPLDLQSRLLRFLDDHEVRRVGAVGARTIEVRVIAATHRDLVAAVRRGRFREDLYFRLSVAALTVPPLRERLADIPILAQLLLDRARAERGRPPIPIAPEAMHVLMVNPWRGNVRELKHVTELLAVTVEGDAVTLEDLPDAVLANVPLISVFPREAKPRRTPSKGAPRRTQPSARKFIPLAQEMSALEKTRMIQALEATGWIQLRAARLLSMARRTFVTKMKLHGIRRPSK